VPPKRFEHNGRVHPSDSQDRGREDPFCQKSLSDRLFMRPLDNNNAGACPIVRGIGRTALDNVFTQGPPKRTLAKEDNLGQALLSPI
jgi:hypothetical protein